GATPCGLRDVAIAAEARARAGALLIVAAGAAATEGDDVLGAAGPSPRPDDVGCNTAMRRVAVSITPNLLPQFACRSKPCAARSCSNRDVPHHSRYRASWRRVEVMGGSARDGYSRASSNA